MAGLAGIIDEQLDKSALEKQLKSMCKIITHEDWFQTFSYANNLIGLGRVSLGIFNPQPQPIFNTDGSLCIILEGEVYNHQQMKQKVAAAGNASLSNNHPELLLHLYETEGLDFVKELNGSFSFAIWDNAEHKLIIVNDRYGLRPIYYSWNHNRFLFASEVKAILQHPDFKKTINDRAVAEFLSFQLVLGNKTLFTDIQILPPASILIYQNRQLSIQQYWDIDFQEDAEKLSEDEYIEQLSFLVHQAMVRQIEGDQAKGVFLSGGLDLRMLLGAIDQQYFPIHTLTMGVPDCNDVRFAAQLAETVGSIHHYSEFKPDFLSSFSEKGVWLTDGMMSCEHLSILNLVPLAREHCQIMFDGLGGDGIMAGLYLKKDLFAEGTNEADVINSAYKRFTVAFSKHHWSHLFTDSYLPKMNDVPYKSFKETIGSLPPQIPANKNDYLYFKNRQRRFIFFGPTLIRSQVECRTPFYDNDLVDFAYTIPAKLKLEKRLHLKILSQNFPEIANIPWTNSGLPVRSSTPYRYFLQRVNYRMQKELKVRLLNKMTSGNITLPYNRKDYNNHSLWLRTHLKNWAEGILLSQSATERGYFNSAYIRQLLDEHMSGQRNHVSRICTLITFELWHRLFID